jgi:peptidyl-tRNA hydrolase
MANTRLTVVVRKDIQMPPGLLAAQVAHLSAMFMTEKIMAEVEEIAKNGEGLPKFPDFSPTELDWMPEPYLSVLAVETYEDLRALERSCDLGELPYRVWEDTIYSPTFEGQAFKFRVGIAIGPADFDAIKQVTGALKPY